MNNNKVCGRFAPSPTGPLHMGSLITALGSYLNAKSKNGRWRVRIEDLDPPREQPGASDAILSTLERFGFEWDGPIMYQSKRHRAYAQALADLDQKGLTYFCACSRKMIAAMNPPGRANIRYGGTCRAKKLSQGSSSTRIQTDNQTIEFKDLKQGQYSQNINLEMGDFIIRRRDGYYAYHLAVVIDDAEQKITEIVRGCDLLNTTPQQIYLQQQLGLPTPYYLHLPVVVSSTGTKLSKQSFARALGTDNIAEKICQTLSMLGQRPPKDLADSTLPDIWNWAITHWKIAMIPAEREIIYRHTKE